MTQILKAVAATAATAILVIAFPGCSKPTLEGRELTVDERQKGDRLSELGKSTAGDWNKLSQSDKDMLIKMSYGNEGSAKMLLQAAAKGQGGAQAPGGPQKAGGAMGLPGGPPGLKR